MFARRAGFPLVVGFASLAAALPAQDGSRYDALAREVFRELIEIDTTNEHGDNTVAAEAMAARLRAAGLPDEDISVLAPHPKKGNLVARLRGSDPAARPILLLAHLDVVEALAADWTVGDPFRFSEIDGYYYGRGTSDDKAMAAIFVVNLIRFLEQGWRPRRDLIVALTADEEGGDWNGVRFLLEQHRAAIDADFALNEGGGGALSHGRRLWNGVQASEKVFQSYRLEARNPGGHSSLPRGDNAIYELARALLRIGEYNFPPMFNEVTRASFERSAAFQEPVVAADLRAVLESPPHPDAIERLSLLPQWNARLRTTCVATQLAGGHAENALPQRATGVVNCRILPGHDPDEVQAQIAALAGEGITVAPLAEATPSPPSPLRPEVMVAIERTTEAMWPGVPVVPTMSTGATDGLWLRRAGIPVYGVSGLFGEIDDVRAHGQDERIGVQSFHEGLEFLNRLVVALAGESTRASE